jgi:hypothetical protein
MQSRPSGALSHSQREAPVMLSVREDPVQEGSRIGRYVLLRDADGRLHALSATAVAALCETDDGCLLMLPGGNVMQVTHSMARVLAWLT